MPEKSTKLLDSHAVLKFLQKKKGFEVVEQLLRGATRGDVYPLTSTLFLTQPNLNVDSRFPTPTAWRWPLLCGIEGRWSPAILSLSDSRTRYRSNGSSAALKFLQRSPYFD